jgi:hypothetical protein
MKKKILIGAGIFILIGLVFFVSLTLSADKDKWSVINTKGHRIWFVSEASKAVLIRWDYYSCSGPENKYYLTYSETVIQPGESIMMPITDNVYVKIPSDKLQKIEGSKVLITD